MTIDLDQIVQQIIEIDKQARDSWHKASLQNEYGIAGGDEFKSWLNKSLRFGDQLAAICYSYGISREILKEGFPQIFSVKHHYDTVKGSEWPSFEDLVLKNVANISTQILDEIFDKNHWNWGDLDQLEKDRSNGVFNDYYGPLITVVDQLRFVNQKKTRIPNKILEIGGGRGELANAVTWMGVSCVSIEPGKFAEMLYNATGKYFFGEEFNSLSPITVDLQKITNTINLSEFDTIIFCESIEHVPEINFWNFWDKVKHEFNGRIIITNWIEYHPIPINPPEHIFEINDAVYDRLIQTSRKCIYRNKSHLVIEM